MLDRYQLLNIPLDIRIRYFLKIHSNLELTLIFLKQIQIGLSLIWDFFLNFDTNLVLDTPLG
jgi:hypothetical protein